MSVSASTCLTTLCHNKDEYGSVALLIYPGWGLALGKCKQWQSQHPLCPSGSFVYGTHFRIRCFLSMICLMIWF